MDKLACVSPVSDDSEPCATTLSPSSTSGNAAGNSRTSDTAPSDTAAPGPQKYGGIDPEDEANFSRVGSVLDDALDASKLSRDQLDIKAEQSMAAVTAPCLQQVHHGHQQLLELPPELLHYVLSYLSPSDLVAASRACRALHSAARDDRLWHALVQANVPGVEVSKPYPHASFRELYPAHEPYWFLPRYKIWFGDWDMIGRVVIALYDPRRGCIEGYQLLARREREKFRSFGDDDSIVIHEFEPKVGLHRDRPVLKLNAQVPDDFKGVHNAKPVLTPSSRAASHRFPERNMRTGIGEHDQLSAVKRLSNEGISAVLRDSLGQRHMWPPSKIPSRDRVARGCTAASRPSRRAEMSDQAFQLRRSIGVPALDLHDLVVTYSTLDPALYTPTEEKPWRGIWVGDYSGHGCEFLLVHQPDDDVDEGDSTSGEKTVTPSSSPCRDERRDGETEEEFAARQKTARTYRGRLEAIKLTGDPNIPRGEFSFVAPDLGEDGYVGTLQKEPFVGARMVKSFGHVASRGFIDHKYINSRLILVSHDRLAQHWLPFGHISYFVRVDIDQLLRL